MFIYKYIDRNVWYFTCISRIDTIKEYFCFCFKLFSLMGS